MATKVRKTRATLKPLRPGHKLRAGRGYRFRKLTGNRVALMRGGLKTATFTCECNASGGCRVEMEGTTATCLERGCTGSCGWVVNVPGLTGGLSAVLKVRR